MAGLALAAAVAVVAGACELDVRLAMDVKADGSGRVQVTFALDRAAAREVGNLGGQLRVDDLRAAGWAIDGPDPTDDGGVAIVAEKRFDGPRGATEAIEQLSGDNGPFRDFRIDRESSFARTRTRFRGTVDLEAGLDAFGDEELRKRLGAPLGVDGQALERRVGRALSEVFGFEVIVRLPGDVESNAPAKAGNGAVWRPKLGEHANLSARAEQWNAASLFFAGLATLTGAAAAVVVVLLLRRSRRRRNGRRAAPARAPSG